MSLAFMGGSSDRGPATARAMPWSSLRENPRAVSGSLPARRRPPLVDLERPRASQEALKRSETAWFCEADEGTRTLDLLHGKRVVNRVLRGRNPAWLSGIRPPSVSTGRLLKYL